MLNKFYEIFFIPQTTLGTSAKIKIKYQDRVNGGSSYDYE